MAVEFKRVAPVFPVQSVSIALALYRRLGFEGTAYGEAGADDPEYGFLACGPVTLHLARTPNLDPKTSISACYLYVSDADALYAAWQTTGIGSGLKPPTDTPYGLREFAYIDPDGNLLRVGSPLPDLPA
jgi:catechol 2,3-dioxygenase-like lactoylglutathione lyase family enzyme